jgi:hypothetical protein
VIHLKDIKYLCGSKDIDFSPIQTYDDEVCCFISDLSEILLKSPETKQYPDIYTFAFWCRNSNIQKLKKEFGNTQYQMGRGLCFHIAPSNIAINFAFSYLFSLLAGNSNIVRLPSKDYPQVSFLCNILNKLLVDYRKILSRTSFIQYSRDNLASTELSKIADARMIWGGDETIKIFKNMSTQPRCVDISFPDRYSICVIDGKKIASSTKNDIERLANDFYYDTYLMDQNACSSPQLIYWLNADDEAKDKFWNHVYLIAKEKYDLQDSVVISKHTQAFINAIQLDNITIINKDNLLYRIKLKSLPENPEHLRGKGGYFFEFDLNNFEELYSKVNVKYQTVTYFGIDLDEFKKGIIKNNLKGIDRVVPIGKAMDIGVFWDGHDLVRELSRKII